MAESGQALQKRQTAYKIKIAGVLNARYFKTEGLNPNYMDIAGKEVYRVNIIAAIVGKEDFSSYINFLIDDGSGRISARIFENTKQAEKIEVGDVVQLIGRPREFSSEKYLLAETIRSVDPRWALIRKNEMKIFNGTVNEPSEAIKEGSFKSGDNREEGYSPSPSSKIIQIIKELDKGGGVSIEELASKNVTDADKMVGMLLKEGDIFEIAPGRLKVL